MSVPSTPRSRNVQWSRMGFDEEDSSTTPLTTSPKKKHAAAYSGLAVPAPPTVPLLSRRVRYLGLFAIILVGSVIIFGGNFPAAYGVVKTPLKRAGERGADLTYVYATPSPELEPYAAHPIHGLMAEARKNWAEKVGRQSRTYEDAVREYRTRNQRDPPKGFRAWYDYATSNDVRLIDEYDNLSANIEPYFALPSAELRSRVKNLQNVSENHAFLSIKGGRQDLPWTGAKWRGVLCELFSETIADFVTHLPDLDFAIFLHDGPGSFLDAEAMSGYVEAAKKKRYVDETQLPIGGTTEWGVRSRTCAPTSRLRRSEVGLENQVTPGPAFIKNHLDSMDYCHQPANLYLHGSTYFQPYLGRLEPSFTLSKTSINSDLLWPAPIQYDLNPKNEIAFADKPVHKLMWRGSPDGVSVTQSSEWRHTHRFRAIYLTTSNDTCETRKVRMTKRDLLGREYQIDADLTLADLNERYMNVRPTQHAVQCEPHLCAHVEAVLPFAPKASLEEMADNRYVLDVDGNAYSARFRTHLLSKQVPLKSTRYPEFYSSQIEPWLHYVPLRQDYSDIYNVMAFFDGDTSPQRIGNHDKLAEEIANAGSVWAQTHWRAEDMKAYMFRLLIEYARLMDPDRDEQGNTAPGL